MSATPLRHTHLALALVAALAVSLVGLGHPARVNAQDTTTLGAPVAPNPVSPDQTASPETDATTPPNAPRHHHRHSSSGSTASPVPTASSTPAGPTYTSFAGTWEVALQPGNRTSYAHLFFDPTQGAQLAGRFLKGEVLTPVSGELDGDRFRIGGADAGGPFALTGYEEGSMTMVGLWTQGNNRIPFTASHQGGIPKPKSPHEHHRRHDKTVAPVAITGQ